jgi:transposase
MVKKYSVEFKQEAVKLVTEHGYSQCEAARRLDLSSKNINRWVCESRDRAPKEKLTIDQQELLRLRKENERLRMEKEILKKAAAFFASEKN